MSEINNNKPQKKPTKKVGPYYNKNTKRWHISKNRVLVPGKGYWSKAGKLYTVYNNDGSVNRYSPKEYADKKNQEIRAKRLKLEHLYSAPALPSKRVQITQNIKGGNNYDDKAIYYTNMLDSVAKYGKMAGVPLQEAIGLYARESTGSNSKSRTPGFFYGGEGPRNKEGKKTWIPIKEKNNQISPVVGLSDWNYIEDNPYKEYINEASKEDDEKRNKWLDGRLYMENEAKKFNVNEPPILHAMKLYKSGKYNKGNSNYSKGVKKRGKELLSSSEIIDWLKNSQYKY